jgi:hypothetical protein
VSVGCGDEVSERNCRLLYVKGYGIGMDYDYYKCLYQGMYIKGKGLCRGIIGVKTPTHSTLVNVNTELSSPSHCTPRQEGGSKSVFELVSSCSSCISWQISLALPVQV